jgi:hypothetical protein
VQKRAPAGRGAPQPLHAPADFSTGAAASGESGGLGEGGGSTGAAEAEVVAAGWGCTGAGAGAGTGAPVPVVVAPGATVPGGGAINDCPQLGQTVQAGSSTIF